MSAGRNPEEFFKRYIPFFEAVDRYADEIKNVLVIGANDGQLADPVGQCWRDEWQGYFVEPDRNSYNRLTEYLEFKKRKYMIFEGACNASDNAKFIRFFRMTSFAANLYKEKTGDHGSALTSTNRYHIAQRLDKHLPKIANEFGIDRLMEDFYAPCFTPTKLLDSSKADLLQVDVEGMEYDIIIETLCGSAEKFPVIILYEHQHLPATACTILDNRAKEAGYTVTHLRNDTLLVKE
jgi:FkbM family methyltransferase